MDEGEFANYTSVCLPVTPVVHSCMKNSDGNAYVVKFTDVGVNNIVTSTQPEIQCQSCS